MRSSYLSIAISLSFFVSIAATDVVCAMNDLPGDVLGKHVFRVLSYGRKEGDKIIIEPTKKFWQAYRSARTTKHTLESFAKELRGANIEIRISSEDDQDAIAKAVLLANVGAHVHLHFVTDHLTEELRTLFRTPHFANGGTLKIDFTLRQNVNEEDLETPLQAHHVRELDLSNIRLNREEVFSKFALIRDSRLRALILSNTDMGIDVLHILTSALRTNTALQGLSLSRNNISDEGAVALGDVLRVNETLQSLGLSYNNIGVKGAKALGEALRANATLQGLYLNYNNVGDEGARVLGENIGTNTALQGLGLAGNNIGNEGARTLGEGLRTNRVLHYLNLIDNNIDDERVAALRKVLRTNTPLLIIRE